MDGSGHIRKGGSVDATRLLEQDHQNVEQLFVQFEQATGETEAKGEIVEQIIRELSIHAAIEEEVFYPAVREAVGDEGMVDHAVVAGEVDLSNAGLLSHFLEQEASSGESVTLDLSGVSFMDSSGMATLLHGLVCTDRSAEQILLHPSRQVRRLLEISGVEARPGLRIFE